MRFNNHNNHGHQAHHPRKRHNNHSNQNSISTSFLLQLIFRLLNQLNTHNPRPKPPTLQPQPEPHPLPHPQPYPQPNQPLHLNPTQKNAIQNHFGLFGEQNFSVIDKDGNNKLSAGDVVSIRRGFNGAHARKITLSPADVNSILGHGNNNNGTELQLSQVQHNALNAHFNDRAPLAYDGLATEFAGTVVDTDRNNRISAGDIVKLRMYGGNGPVQTDKVVDHTLTAREAFTINSRL